MEDTPGNWRDYLRTEEVLDGASAAGALFHKSFRQRIPDYPRHFVLRYFENGTGEGRVVAYVHQTPFNEVYLGGGMCVDESAYRAFPKWLFRAVRDEGGLATIVTRDSIAMMGDSPAAFGHVGEPRARQADLRTGYVDTGRPHIMVFWRKALPVSEQQRLIDMVEAFGPF